MGSNWHMPPSLASFLSMPFLTSSSPIWRNTLEPHIAIAGANTSPYQPTTGTLATSMVTQLIIEGSWLKFNVKSLESQLLSTLLPCELISKLSTFLKLRRLILKTTKSSLLTLDDISLEHEDILGIIHTAFTDSDTRRILTEGIKKLFISFKMQQAK